MIVKPERIETTQALTSPETLLCAYIREKVKSGQVKGGLAAYRGGFWIRDKVGCHVRQYGSNTILVTQMHRDVSQREMCEEDYTAHKPVALMHLCILYCPHGMRFVGHISHI